MEASTIRMVRDRLMTWKGVEDNVTNRGLIATWNIPESLFTN